MCDIPSVLVLVHDLHIRVLSTSGQLPRPDHWPDQGLPATGPTV